MVVCDFDETIYSKNILKELFDMKQKGFTIWSHKTFDMITDEFPAYNGELMHEIVKTGILSDKGWGKNLLFNPNDISEINYNHGAHICSPSGNLSYYTNNNIYMFHFKYLSIQYVINKYRMYQNRLSDLNKRYGWGVQYNYDDNRISDEFNNMFNKKINTLNYI